ncbi:MAG: thermonuclease family protein [Akkermansiaceae bacterium]
MAGKVKSGGSWFTVLLVIAAVAIWAYEQKPPAQKSGSPRVSQVEKSPTPPASKSTTTVRKTGRYEVYENCVLAEARNNDGDSFRVRLPDGRTEEIRLYFVDTPESAFKRYSGGETNHPRIRQQAADLGGITPEQAVEIGKKAKAFTLALLATKPFTIFTEWDSPYSDQRYHAHIEVTHDGKTRWLHQLLVERGLARIKTKASDLPDGTSAAKEKAVLQNLERNAKRIQTGVWGL